MNKFQRGVALLETMVAVLLLGLGILGAIGLQTRAGSALADASMRAEATVAAEKLITLMSMDQANLSAFNLASGGSPDQRMAAWYNETLSNIPGATITNTVTAVAGTTRTRVVTTISWARKSGDPTHQHTITSYIAGSL